MQLDPPIWNEHGERVRVKISSADVGLEDIPRVVREHRDLRKALKRALELIAESGFDPADPRTKNELEYIKQVKNRNPF